jgi:hypothetical protein
LQIGSKKYLIQKVSSLTKREVAWGKENDEVIVVSVSHPAVIVDLKGVRFPTVMSNLKDKLL